MLRIALSPTKDMSISDLRIAILNYLVAKQKNEELLIRIDDTQKDKNIEKKDKEIVELLNLFSIEHSRILFQSENIKYHTGMAMKLLLDKKAFNCFCSEEALKKDKKKAKKEGKVYSYSGFCETISDETKFQCNAPFVVRLKKPNENINFDNTINDKYSFTPDEVDSVVILNHDKTPTANFASAVDDMLFDINIIINSDDKLMEAPKQIHIRESLDYNKNIEYIHIPNIQSEKEYDSVKKLIDEGYLPGAIANYLVLLDVDAPREIFSLEEALSWFDINKITNKPITFDIKKLKQINKEYLKNMDDMRLSKLLGYADSDIGILGKVFLNELSTLKEIKSKIENIFSNKEAYKTLDKECKKIKELIKELPYIESFEDFEKIVKEKSELDGEVFKKSFSYVLTGDPFQTNLKDIYSCIKNYLGEIV